MSGLFKKLKEYWKNKSKYEKTMFITRLSILVVVGLFIFVQVKKMQNTDAIKFYAAIDNAEEVPYKDFQMMAYNSEVDTLYYHTGNEKMAFTLYNDETKDMSLEELSEYTYDISDWRITQYPAGDDFRTKMLSFNIKLVLVRDDTTGQTILSYIIALLPTVVMVAVFIWMSKSMTKGIGGMNADDIIQQSDVKLSDIIGLDELMDEFNLIIKIIKDPSYGDNIGVTMPNGILLSGDPGVGKTMIAKAISCEAGVPFISVNGSDFVELYVGNGAKRVRELFRIAREHAPCIIFIDEFDAIGEKRSSVKSNSEDSKTINALLKEMDGFKELERVFVLAATNNPEKLDSAVKRSGRFDREIKIQRPRDWRVRKKLFEHYLADKAVSDDVDLDTIARTVAGFTGADISVVCNEAGLVALSHNLEYITHDCIEEAIDKKILKGNRSKTKVNEKDRAIVSYHEAGHAIMSILTNTPVSRASIQSTTSGVGGVVLNEDTDSQFQTAEDLVNRVMVCYAGRISEKIKFKSVTTGASNDISQATNVLNAYINKYGFDEKSGLIDIELVGTHSEYTEDRIRKLSEEIYKKASSLLSKNYNLVELLAQKLLEKEAMTGKEIRKFLKENGVEIDDQE